MVALYQIAMPNDAVSIGYKQTRPYQWEQIFVSISAGFTGTEREFVQHGYGYKYRQIDEHTRVIVA